MHKEIEVKIMEVDPQEVHSKLLELGVSNPETIEMISTTFKLPKKKHLRVRSENGIDKLTIKIDHDDKDMSVCDEYEVTISDGETIIKGFEALGYEKKRVLEKTRTQYMYKNSHVLIDEIEGIPPWMEIESPNKEELIEIAKELGFDETHFEVMGHTEIFRRYKPENL